MIKAIETIYNGYKFRSRLEARWAVFFDTLGIKYRYEPEGFDLGETGWYLPDFYLDFGYWVEIKPSLNAKFYTDVEYMIKVVNQVSALSRDNPVLLIGGSPYYGDYNCLVFHNGVAQVVGIFATFRFKGQFDGLCVFDEKGSKEQGKMIYFPITTFEPDALNIDNACTAARQARFEHRQNGLR